MKDGEPEYSTLRQDSTPSPITSAALRKLSLTPYMHAINLERESIAYSTLQSWSPHISNLTAKTTGPPHNETGPPLTSICRPMMKSADSKSLLALAKALLSLQRATQSRHALRRENLYVVLRSSFRTALIKTLGEKTTLSYGEEDDMSDEKDSELMKIAFQEENRDRCFLTLAENLKAPLWVFEGRILQSREKGMSFEEEYAKLYMPQGKVSSSLALYFSPTTSEFFRVALTDPQGLDFLTSSQDWGTNEIEPGQAEP